MTVTKMADLELLGNIVADLSKTIAGRLQAGNHPLPSFAANSPATLPAEADIQEPRLQLIEALSDLFLLVTGPGDYLFLHAGLFYLHDSTVLDILNQFDFYSKVPISGSVSYGDLAQATNLPEIVVRRVLRYAFTMRVFAPESSGSDRVIHSAISAHAARTPELRSWVEHHLEDCRPATMTTAEALRRFSAGKERPTEDLDETSFGLAWPPGADGRLVNFWSLGKEHPKEAWRAKRFAEAMRASVLSVSVQADDVVDKFDWDALGEATVVDVGGSNGTLSVILARKHPKLRLIVQDLPEVETAFNAHLPADIADRVTFQVQDFFEPQPQPVDVFLMKHILHNWSDKYAVKILLNLIAALNPGGRIIVCDSVVPSQNEADSLPLSVRKGIAAADIQMMMMLNSLERTVEDWEQLTRKTDERLRVANVHIVPGAMVSLLEIVLDA